MGLFANWEVVDSIQHARHILIVVDSLSIVGVAYLIVVQVVIGGASVRAKTVAEGAVA